MDLSQYLDALSKRLDECCSDINFIIDHEHRDMQLISRKIDFSFQEAYQNLKSKKTEKVCKFKKSYEVVQNNHEKLSQDDQFTTNNHDDIIHEGSCHDRHSNFSARSDSRLVRKVNSPAFDCNQLNYNANRERKGNANRLESSTTRNQERKKLRSCQKKKRSHYGKANDNNRNFLYDWDKENRTEMQKSMVEKIDPTGGKTWSKSKTFSLVHHIKKSSRVIQRKNKESLFTRTISKFNANLHNELSDEINSAVVKIQSHVRSFLCRMRREAEIHGFLTILAKQLRRRHNRKAKVWNRWKKYVSCHVWVKEQTSARISMAKTRRGEKLWYKDFMDNFYKEKESIRVWGGIGEISTKYLLQRRLSLSWSVLLKNLILQSYHKEN